MKQIVKQVFWHWLTFAMAMSVSVVCLLGVAHPAIAFGNTNSQPAEGSAQMNQIQENSRQAVSSEPRNREQVQKQAQNGPNEVQGNADLRGMNVPNDSGEATTVRKQVEKALEQVVPGQ